VRAAHTTALNAYAATMHFNGQSMVELDGDRATGEASCLAHHLTEAEDGSRTLINPRAHTGSSHWTAG
jgi:hypothetical protein